MESDGGSWTALLSRIATDGNFEFDRMAEVRLRRQMEARMRARGLRSQAEYVQLLSTNPGEYLALIGALQTTRRRSRGMAQTRAIRGSQLRRWIESLPVPTLVAEGIPGSGGMRLLAANRAARTFLIQPVDALRAASERHQWLHLDGTPCRDRDLPLHRAIWRGLTSHNEPLLLRDAAGHRRAVIVDTSPFPGRRLRAVMSVRAAEAWQAEPEPAVPKAALGQYERLYEEAAVPIILASQSGTVLETNARAREVLRAQDKEVVGAPLSGLLADESVPAYHQAVASLVHSGKARARLTLLSQPDLILEALAREIRSEPPLVQWVLYDVTHYVATDRMRRDLIDLVLHDLRSPLATSSLGVETIERGIERGDTSRVRRALSMVSAAMRRLGRLVDSLLDLSRLEAGQPILQPAESDFGPLLLAAAAEVELALAPRHLHLELEVPGDLPAIIADGDMLYRATVNLLDNAIKFSPQGGEVRLSAMAQDHGILISVSDQGPGIPRELQPRIFDKFIGQYLPQAPRSYGLGLSFCKLAVEAHGGWLAVDSAPGRGSTFAFWVPVRPG